MYIAAWTQREKEEHIFRVKILCLVHILSSRVAQKMYLILTLTKKESFYTTDKQINLLF